MPNLAQPTPWRFVVGRSLAVLLGMAFVGLGTALASRGDLTSSALAAQRLFGVRDAFLGTYLLLLSARRDWAAVRLFLTACLVLPVLDTLVLAPSIGLAKAVIANLPFLIPLALAAALIGGGTRSPRDTHNLG